MPEKGYGTERRLATPVNVYPCPAFKELGGIREDPNNYADRATFVSIRTNRLFPANL